MPEVAVDPICNEDVATAILVSGYEGKTYYSCNPYCKETFGKDPKQYKGQDFRNKSFKQFF
ncbi:MAG: YHS domain-containing protein [Candidatus Thorarchaeota archaeon]